jgi:Dolichyl-phosphate-mannose-protein mannosyltransferase
MCRLKVPYVTPMAFSCQIGYSRNSRLGWGLSMRQANEWAFWSALSSPYFVPVCFAVYLSFRLAIVIFLPIDQFSDNVWYYARAVGLASGHGYSEDGLLTAYWPPGWPGFLGLMFWLFGPSPFVGQMANLVLAAITFVLALSLGSMIFADKLVGRLTVLILTIYPNQIGYVPPMATEVFYTALLLLAIFVVIRDQALTALVLSGIVFGIATLTKAQTLFIPAVLFGVWWLAARKRERLFSSFGKAVVVYAAMAVVILPWSVRNYVAFGEFVLISTNGGGTLLSGNNPSAWGDYTEDDALVKQVPNDVAGQVTNDRLATSLAMQWIRDNPVAFVALIPRKIWRLWAPDGEAEWVYQAGFKNYDNYWALFRLVRGVNQFYYSVMMILFVLSALYCLRRRPALSPYFLTGYALTVYFTALSIVFSGQSRFHFPLMPWVAMYTAWIITQWAGKSARGGRGAVAVGA